MYVNYLHAEMKIQVSKTSWMIIDSVCPPFTLALLFGVNFTVSNTLKGLLLTCFMTKRYWYNEVRLRHSLRGKKK